MSWYDSAWVPLLNQSNILDYFCERSNPFYDHTCNNQIIKSQRLSQDQLKYSYIASLSTQSDIPFLLILVH